MTGSGMAAGLTGAPLICIVGPTASGKSELAEEVACRLGGAVVSVDAMQVYRGMDIGTAKTPPCERRCDLLMVDVCDVDEDYSVQRFQQDARARIDGLRARGRVPVLCGGTGLYLDAVIDEMAFPAGETGSPARRRYEAYAADRGSGALHALLAARDPASAALIHPNNVRRVVRALEMADEGASYAAEHAHLKEHVPRYPARIWAVSRPREELYRRIDARVDAMMASGLVEEVRSLAKQGLSEQVTAGQAIGYKEVLAYLDGRTGLEEAVGTIKARSRRYAKRQLSWIRRDGRARVLDRDRLSLEEAADLVIEDWRSALAGSQARSGDGHPVADGCGVEAPASRPAGPSADDDLPRSGSGKQAHAGQAGGQGGKGD